MCVCLLNLNGFVDVGMYEAVVVLKKNVCLIFRMLVPVFFIQNSANSGIYWMFFVCISSRCVLFKISVNATLSY